MALRNTAPLDRSLKATFNWVTQSGASVLKNLPFGGATGVVLSGIVLWFKPALVPEGWSAEAVLSLGMGGGVVAQRIFDGLLGWFVEPARLPPRCPLGGVASAAEARGLSQPAAHS